MIFYCSSCLLYCLNQKILSTNCILENTSVGRSGYTPENFCEIESCFFVRFECFSGSGGVIYYSGGGNLMKIKSCVFNHCQVGDQYEGGAIYFNSESFFMDSVCCFMCTAGWGHFSAIYSTNNNSIYMSTLTKCSGLDIGYYPISLYSGYQNIESTNISGNKANQISGFLMNNPKYGYCSFCTIWKSSSSQSICMYFDKGKGLTTRTNIISNNSPFDYGVVCVNGACEIYIKDSYFRNNSNTLFNAISGILDISSCDINHEGKLTGGAVTLGENTSPGKSQSLTLVHFNTYLCEGIHTVEKTKNQNSKAPFFKYLSIFLINNYQ